MSAPAPLLIRGGRVLGADGREVPTDLYCDGGRVAELRAPGGPAESAELDANGCWLLPGPIDAHVHLREPGAPEKETLASGLAAAAAGGFCAVAAMPNTEPPPDTPDRVRDLTRRAAGLAGARLHVIATASQGREGRRAVDFDALVAAGARGFSDDGSLIGDPAVLRAALVASARLGVAVQEHCEDPQLLQGGVLHDGEVARSLGLPGRPAAAEVAAVRRGIALAAETGGRFHVQHISAAAAVDEVREAKARGLRVTAEVTPHHLRLTEDAAAGGDTSARVNPPLRTAADRDALVAGLADGTIDLVATDHAPHTAAEKARDLAAAPPGLVGLETALPLIFELVRSGAVDRGRLVDALCGAPARLLGLRGRGALEVGAPADVALFDPDARWTVDPERFRSLGRNTPFAGWQLTGRVRATVVAGAVVYRDEA